MTATKKRYFDYAATTPVKKEVLDAMLPYFTEHYGNASSVHSFGREAKVVIDKARNQVADAIGSSPDEVFFTGGGSEADNWALKGYARQHKNKGNHIITTKIEHHAILHTCQALEKEGFEVTYLDVDDYGLVTADQVKAAIRPETILVTIMYVNNEIGTVEPIEEIAAVTREAGVAFHTDGVQALGNLHVDVKALGVDMMSLSAHKIYGPKGVGVLYIRKGIRLQNLIEGGAQERKRRAGTENLPGIVGFGKAAEMATATLDYHIEELSKLRDRLAHGIIDRIPEAKYNGHPEKRHPGNVNVCFKYIEGESLLLSLDLLGVAASSGSACTSGSLDPSHVLMSIGLTHEIAHGSLRLTVGDFTTEEDVDFVIENLVTIVDRLRQMSPLYNG